MKLASWVEDTFRNALRMALRAARLPESLTVYETTRHTFGAQWVINGGSLHKLAAVLGHSSTEVTMRYGHPRRRRVHRS